MTGEEVGHPFYIGWIFYMRESYGHPNMASGNATNCIV
jgi:hypothetical protein